MREKVRCEPERKSGKGRVVALFLMCSVVCCIEADVSRLDTGSADRTRRHSSGFICLGNVNQIDLCEFDMGFNMCRMGCGFGLNCTILHNQVERHFSETRSLYAQI